VPISEVAKNEQPEKTCRTDGPRPGRKPIPLLAYANFKTTEKQLKTFAMKKKAKR